LYVASNRSHDIYFSVDVESDGPIPGPFSMLSFALVAVATFDGEHFVRFESHEAARYWELQPISEHFEPEALSINGLDRERLRREGTPPADAMQAADRWVRRVASGRRAVLVAYPAAFDWSFIHWYFSSYLGRSPFGHGSCIDIRSLYIGAAGSTYDESSKDCLPSELRPRTQHTHNALDDAVEQGELFSNIFEWALRRLPSYSSS
jgi:DNA polymerase III epsilon subunit-like protein